MSLLVYLVLMESVHKLLFGGQSGWSSCCLPPFGENRDRHRPPNQAHQCPLQPPASGHSSSFLGQLELPAPVDGGCFLFAQGLTRQRHLDIWTLLLWKTTSPVLTQ